MTVEYISLCRASASDDGKIWLIRLADINDKVLAVPKIDDNAVSRTFENRTRIYCNDNFVEDGSFGVWKWSASPSYKDPEKDYVQSSYAAHICVIEVIMLSEAASVNEIIEILKNGIASTIVSKKVLFCPGKEQGSFFEGVLCTEKNIIIKEGKIFLRDDAVNLPLYSIRRKDILTLEGKLFYNRLECKELLDTIPLKEPMSIIKTLIRNRISWTAAQSLGIPRKDWQKITAFIMNMPEKTIIQEAREIFNCSAKEAENLINSFIEKAEEYIDHEDYDSKILEGFISASDTLMKKCVEIASSRCHDEIDKVQSELKAVQALTEEKRNELISAENELSSAQKRLSALKQKITEQEELALSVQEQVRARIEKARSEAAAFIAEMAFSAPESCVLSEKVIHCGKDLTHGQSEAVSSCKELVDVLSYNLVEAGVCEKYSYGFAAFLYSAFVNKTSVLLAGPGGRSISDAFSAALTGRTAGVIDCSAKYYADIEKDIASAEDDVFAVINGLRNEWIMHIPDMLMSSKYFFIVHPFTEDLLIEPKSLFSYVLPVLTEPLVDQSPSGCLIKAAKTEDFNAFTHKASKPEYHSQLKSMAVSSYARSRIQAVLTDFHELYGADSDMDYLLALVPRAYISGRLDSSLLSDISDGDLRDDLRNYASD